MKKKKVAEKERTLKMYLCGVDWQHELGEASDGTRLFPSLEALKEHHRGIDQCGAVRVKVTFSKIKWVVPQNFQHIEFTKKEET